MLGILLLVHNCGIRMMIVSYCVFNALWLFVWLHFAKKEIAIKCSMFLCDVVPYMLLSVLVMTFTWLATIGINDLLLLLILKIVIAAVLYIVAALVMKSKELKEITDFLLKRNKCVL